MKGQDLHSDSPAQLRRHAEDLAVQNASQPPTTFLTLSLEETRRVLHELRVHQIELEMQNEELRAAQEELDASRSQYFDLYDLAPVGYLTISEKGLILEANLTTSVLLNAARRSLIKQPISRFIAGEDQDNYYLLRNALFETGKPQACDLRMIRGGRPEFWARMDAALAHGEKGSPVCRIVISDISDLKRMEETLRDTITQAQAATVAKSQFLATMSHEIRTPMNGVLGMASLLATTELNEEQKQYVDILNQVGERMMTVINEILDISKIEAGKMEISSKPLSIKPLVEGTLAPLVPLAQKKGLRFSIDISPDIPKTLLGDKNRIAQVLTNLVGNAIKFTEEGGVFVRCELLKKGKSSAIIRFRVSDTGIGIPPDKLEQIFDPFYQVDGSNTREYGGTGLGLAISRKLVEIMRGELKIESTEKKGTTCSFVMSLLITVADQTESDDRTNLREWNSLHGRILIVEDDEVSAFMVNALVKKLGITADTVETGAEALKKLKSNGDKYDLILMDCQMPVMDGYETTKAIRGGLAGESWRSIPIIAQTAAAMSSDEYHCLESGMNDYISKPLDLTTLISVLNKWL